MATSVQDPPKDDGSQCSFCPPRPSEEACRLDVQLVTVHSYLYSEFTCSSLDGSYRSLNI